jgi:hypothetical protein
MPSRWRNGRQLGCRAEAGRGSFTVKLDAPAAPKPSPSSRISRKGAFLNPIFPELLPHGVAREWRVQTAFSLRSAVRSGQSFLPGKDSLRRIRRRLGENPRTSRRCLATACKSSRAEAKPRSPRCERRQQRLGIRSCSCEQLFDLEISSADAVRLVPMDLGFSNMPGSKDSNMSYGFHLTPSSGASLPPKGGEHANLTAGRDRLDAAKLSDDLELHAESCVAAQARCARTHRRAS